MIQDLFKKPVVGGNRLLLSMSGGRTSAYMTRFILNEYSHLWKEIIVVFANTGQEDERTLEFVNNCDKKMGFNTIWVEAVVHPEKGKGTTHKIVSFETAARNGEPFEDMIKKYGIPNMTHPHCTRELKQRAIESYAKSIGWKNDYVTAIGIRPDEMRRVNSSAVKQKIVYPLIDWFHADKEDVLYWWENQEFDLEIEEHQGNCSWCWKKSFKKHAMLLSETPNIYDFPKRMEVEYGYIGPKNKTKEAYPRTFFRGNRSVENLKEYCDEIDKLRFEFNQEDSGGCGESCELYPTLPLFEALQQHK